ncbi:glycosyltransferase [Bradyrhizobium sp. BR2003]|nr:glycosyltransferase [Bradyrhizobium sp. BR2003]
MFLQNAELMRQRLPLLRAASRQGPFSRIGTNASGTEVVMLVVSDLRIDPRVEREARALAEAGYEVTVLCPEPSDGAGESFKIDWGPSVSIKWLNWTAASFVSESPGYVGNQLYAAAVTLKPFAFHAHDLNTAYVALAAANVTGAHLIVDFHEWFSENVHWDSGRKEYLPYPQPWKRQLQKLEARCLREASATVTVCDSIADAMNAELGGKRPLVVRNIPNIHRSPTKKYPPLKEQLSLDQSTFVLLWQGGTGPTRLIEPIIQALEYATKCVLVIRGPSLDLFGEGYRKLAAEIGAEGRLILLPPVPSHDVVAAARGADAGIWTLPALCRNFTFALPNKIFEYLASDLPVLAADYPEARRLVSGNQVGLMFDPYDPKSIARSINKLIEQADLAARLRANIGITLASLDAGREWQRLVEVYKQLPRR